LQERPGEKGIIISTAHPVKFPEIVEQEVGRPVSLPDAVQGLMNKPSLKTKMEVSYDKLKAFLVELS
jgi:threonine synthase